MHIPHIKDWPLLVKIACVTFCVCLFCLVLALCWHPFADAYTSYVYIWITVPQSALVSVLPFSIAGLLGAVRVPVLCVLVALFGIALFALRKWRSLVLKIGVPVLFVYLVIFAHSLMGTVYFDPGDYSASFLISFVSTLAFLVFVVLLSGKISPDVYSVWLKVLLITLICLMLIGTFLCLLPALTTTITDQNGKADVTYSPADMTDYGLRCLDDLEAAYHELIEICGSPDKVVFPTYEKMESEIIAALHKASDKYPSLAGYYPKVRFYDNANPVFQNNIVGLFVPASCEILIKDNLRNSSLPSVVAHEYAHLKGFLRESEADYVSDYVCINANDPWVRYSGYYNIFSRMLSVLKTLEDYADYNVLVTRYNKIFEDAYHTLSLTPADGLLSDYAADFTPEGVETLSATISIEVTLTSPDEYDEVRAALSNDPAIRALPWTISVNSTNGTELSSLHMLCKLQAELPARPAPADALLSSLDALLDRYVTRFGQDRVDWLVKAKQILGFTSEERLDRFEEDLAATMQSAASDKALVTALDFQYEMTDASDYETVLSDLRTQTVSLKEALADLGDVIVSLGYSWTGMPDDTQTETLFITVRVQFPAVALPDDFRARIETAMPAVLTTAFTEIYSSLEHQKTQAELDAEAAAAREAREKANAVFEPVRYFTFSSAVSDYATSIRYLMELYYTD